MTVMLLLRHARVDQEYKNDLKKEMLFFSNVEIIAPATIHWSSIRFRRNNGTYCMLISLCQLILEGMLLTTDSGEYKLASFGDKQCINRLYAKFIFEYYAEKMSAGDSNSLTNSLGFGWWRWRNVTNHAKRYYVHQRQRDAYYRCQVFITHTTQSQYDVHILYFGDCIRSLLTSTTRIQNLATSFTRFLVCSYMRQQARLFSRIIAIRWVATKSVSEPSSWTETSWKSKHSWMRLEMSILAQWGNNWFKRKCLWMFDATMWMIYLIQSIALNISTIIDPIEGKTHEICNIWGRNNYRPGCERKEKLRNIYGQMRIDRIRTNFFSMLSRRLVF